ncbi:recombinase family protein [Streptomyces decoyicus]|uniref:recombinase family protein n=1 Tax=Streptomyces decoyicus TaxID=249567 RepID=UPI003643B407
MAGQGGGCRRSRGRLRRAAGAHSARCRAMTIPTRMSGEDAEREELWKALDHLREGGTLVVPSPDRLGRSLQGLIAIVSGLRKRGVGLLVPWTMSSRMNGR